MLNKKPFPYSRYKPDYESFSKRLEKALLRKSILESTNFDHEINRPTKLADLPQDNRRPTGGVLPGDPATPDFQPLKDFHGLTRDAHWNIIRGLLRDPATRTLMLQYRNILDEFRRGVPTKRLLAQPLDPTEQVDAQGMTASGLHTFKHNGMRWVASPLSSIMHAYRHMIHNIEDFPNSLGVPATSGYFPKVATTVIPEKLRSILGKLGFPEDTYENTVSDNITMHHGDAERANQSIEDTPRRPAFFFMPDAHEAMFRHLNKTSDAPERHGEPFIPREQLGYLLGSHHIDTESGTPFTIIHHFIASHGRASTEDVEGLTEADEHDMWKILKDNPHLFIVGDAHSHPPGNLPLQSGGDLLNAITGNAFRQPYNMSIVHGSNAIRDRQGNVLTGAAAHEYLRDHAQADLQPENPLIQSAYGGRSIVPYTDSLMTTSSVGRATSGDNSVYPVFDPDTGRATIPNPNPLARLYGDRSITEFLSGYHGAHKVDYPVGNLARHRYRYGTYPDHLARFLPVKMVQLPSGGMTSMVSLPSPLPANYVITKMGRLSTPYQIQFVGRHGGPALQQNTMGGPHNANTIGAPLDDETPVGQVPPPQLGPMLDREVADARVADNKQRMAAQKRTGILRRQKAPDPVIEHNPEPRIVRSLRSHPFPFASYPHETGLRKGDQD